MGRTVLELLEQAGENYLSGEAISRELGVTRAAVWKQVRRLRDTGYTISAVTNLGYRLEGRPEKLDLAAIQGYLGNHPWRDRLTVLETVDSTNNLCKAEAIGGVPEGSIYLSDEQTGGRGRQGRSFLSPRGKGLYLSVLLRPNCPPTQVGHATAMAAVAACDSVEAACGIRPGIKWTNDLILNEKKMTGILSEMSVEWESSTLEYVVIGIGINCAHSREDFPEELRDKATSIAMEMGRPVDRNLLAAELIRNLSRVAEDLVSNRSPWMERYAENCITVGREVKVIRGENVRLGTATGIDENGALLVRYENGETGVVFSGEVSVRGVNGYI